MLHTTCTSFHDLKKKQSVEGTGKMGREKEAAFEVGLAAV